MANQTAYLDSMLRWGLDWLIKVAFLTILILEIYYLLLIGPP